MATRRSAIGRTVAASASTRPPSCTKAAPTIIWMQPRNPAALPAACGRTLIAPAIAFGSITPLPKPVTSCGTKMLPRPPAGGEAPRPAPPAPAGDLDAEAPPDHLVDAVQHRQPRGEEIPRHVA